MPSPNREPISTPRRDPKRMAGGKAVLLDIVAGRSEAGLLAQDDLADAIYYLDGALFLPTGGARASRGLRNEAKKRGVL